MVERKAKENVVLDPEPYMERMLHYREKHSAWYIFQSIYVGIYFFIVGSLFVLQGQTKYDTRQTFGISLVILSFMVIVYGFVMSLHAKLMKRYG